MLIRIAVAVDPEGDWNACGWSGGTDAEKMGIACDTVGEGEARYWVEVDVPMPGQSTLPATVTRAE